MKRTFTAVALATFAWAAQAHQVWIEQDARGAKLYFGEFGDNLREASPGLLDKFGAPVAQKLTAKGAEPLTPAKAADGFAIPARAARGESITAEDPAYPSFEVKQGDKVSRGLYVPAARLVADHGRQEPRLTLDLVPTGQGGRGKGDVELQAFYKGQPLAKAKVVVVTASGWSRELRTDAAGKLTVNLPWKGTYVLELSHTDTAGGERGTEAWSRASFVTSLTLPQPQGLPALPAAPAAKPNEAH
jgi:hypothetical protein